eukprot:maker-scaffold_54-snap-gene-0.42-mRNA-1 protein AED:0.26 eAED:0.26 QI:23/1/1/1/1/1/2/40/384
MCMNTLGEVSFGEDACGIHGTCVNQVCICESGWENSIELFPTLFIKSGAREIYNNLTDLSDFVSLDEFKKELLNKAPCSRLDGLYYTIVGLTYICTLVALWKHIPFALSKKRRFKRTLPQILTFMFGFITAIFKTISLDNIYPFHFGFSFSLALLYVSSNIAKNIFYVKFVQYHLKKAKKVFGIEVTFLGYSMDSLLKVQQRYIIFIDIIFLSFTYFLPIFVSVILDTQDNFNFNLLVLSQIVYLVLFYYSFIYLAYLLVLNHVVFTGLEKDFAKLLSISRMNTNPSSGSNSKTAKINRLLKNTHSIKLSIFSYTLIWFIVFGMLIFFYQTQGSLQYFNMIACGILWPIHTTNNFNRARKEKKDIKEKNMVLPPSSAQTNLNSL